MPDARVLVLGAGAIGAFYGGVLARAGCEVSVVARADYDAVAAGGYRIESTLGDLSFRPAQLLRSAGDYRGEADYVLVALKLTRGIDRATLIAPALAAGSAIVLVQNGIGIEDEVARAFPQHELLSGVAYAAVSREAPGRVRHHSKFTRLVLGRYPGGASENATRFAGLLKAGGSSCVVTEVIVGARWEKSAWNAVFNPLSAIGGGLGTRDILSGDEQTAFVRAAIAEVCAVAAADGHPLAPDLPERQIDGTRRMPNYVSSMGQDRLAGRPMETEALVGNAVRIARRLGVAVPRLESLYALLRMSESQSGTA
ncbi:MAG TPA: 2-dehydropantoate 2-reductase [Burkholderiales bacterium]|nr:2-dehydropantoate 2-reductase [Burkholderiales bacterium]